VAVTKFDALARKLERRGAKDPEALAAHIGRAKHGKAAFQAMAAAGRRPKAARKG
jgi:hypothetical protein